MPSAVIKDPRISATVTKELQDETIKCLLAGSDFEIKQLMAVGSKEGLGVSVIMNIDENGVLGTGWATIGNHEKPMRMPVEKLYGKGGELRFWITLGNLSKLEFGRNRKAANVSQWMDVRTDLKAGFYEANREVPWEEAEAKVEELKNGMAARAFIVCRAFEVLELGLEIVPMNPAKLKEFCDENNKDMDSLEIPALMYPIGQSHRRFQPKQRINYTQVENKRMGYKLGHLPIFSVVGDKEKAKIPSMEQLKREVFTIHRNTVIPFMFLGAEGDPDVWTALRAEWTGKSSFPSPRWKEGPAARAGGSVGELKFLCIAFHELRSAGGA